MTASFPATQAIWPTSLRLPGAVDQGDSCLHLRLGSLRSEGDRDSLPVSSRPESEVGRLLQTIHDYTLLLNTIRFGSYLTVTHSPLPRRFFSCIDQLPSFKHICLPQAGKSLQSPSYFHNFTNLDLLNPRRGFQSIDPGLVIDSLLSQSQRFHTSTA